MGRRVVVVMIEPPLPFGSAAGRWYYVLLKGLVARGHEVTAFAANCREGDSAEAARWYSPTQLDLRCFPAVAKAGIHNKLQTLRRPYSYVFSDALRTELDAALRRRFDVLHCEQHWAGWLAMSHRPRTLLNVHYLYDIDLGPTPVTQLRDALRVRRERQLLRCFPALGAVTNRLAAHLAQIAPRSDVHTLPLVLDTSFYPFTERQRTTEVPPTVGLIGSFTWGPSYDAGRRLIDRLWPSIAARVPRARLLIAGRSAAQLIAGRPCPHGVTVVEDMPDAIPCFMDIDVMLYAPARGSGAKVKVFEAFALGTPVVTTPDGVEGLDAIDGVHAGIGSDDADLVERTVALLNNPAAAERQRVAARQLIERHCDLARAIDRVEAAHDALCRRGIPSVASR